MYIARYFYSEEYVLILVENILQGFYSPSSSEKLEYKIWKWNPLITFKLDVILFSNFRG